MQVGNLTTTGSRNAVFRAGTVAIVWLGASLSAIAVALTVEYLLHQPHRIGLLGLISIASFAVRLALVLGAALAAAHVLRLGIDRRRPNRGLLLSTSVVAACALFPTWEVASFLTSGEAIARHAWVTQLRWLLVLLLLPAYPLTWLWHFNGAEYAVTGRPTTRVRALAWAALGGAFAAAVFLVVGDSRLRAYGTFARYLLPLALVVASSVVFVVSWSRPRLRWLVLGGGLCLAIVPATLSARELERGRTIILGRSMPARLLEMQVRREKPAYPGLDVLAQQGAACDAREHAPSRFVLRPDQRKNVLLIGIDALRADFVDYSIGSTPIAPNLARWSSSALRFPNAVTPQPRTKMALAALAYGIEPMSTIGAAPKTPHLIQILAQHTSHQLYVFPEYLRGVAPLDNSRTQFLDDTDAVTDAIVAALSESGEGGLFAWVHYIAPHLPHVDRLGLNLAPPPLGPYAAEVVEVDRSLARVFAKLETGGFADNTLIVLYADHGYSLGEGGYIGYWTHLHRASVNVPLIVSGPGIAPERTSSIATMIDIAPTVLEFLSIDRPDTMRGIGLLEQVRSPRTSYVAETHALSAQIAPGDWRARSLAELGAAHLRASEPSGKFLAQLVVLDQRWQLKLNRITGSHELYAIDDIHEEREMSASQAQTVARLQGVLDHWNARYAHEAYCAWRYGR